MGWSYAAKAGYVFDAIGALIARPGQPSNTMPDGGFYETSRRERPDGAITGTIWRKLNAAEKARWAHLDNLDARVTRRGSFHISGDGKIERFPGLPKEIKVEAERRGAAEYKQIHEPGRYNDQGVDLDHMERGKADFDFNVP